MNRASIVAWLRLVRPPNLPTVPGDPLAGFLLAGGAWGWPVLWVAAAALCLYAAGLILNDVADVELDRRERPSRPLPSGAVSVRAARLVGCALLLAGVALAGLAGPAALAAGMALGLLTICYDFATPRGSVAGLLTIGACRAASVVLGIAAASPRLVAAAPVAWLAAAGLGCYIVAVSLLAAGETRQSSLGLKRWLPLATAALAILSVLALAPATPRWRLGLACALIALWSIWQTTHRTGPAPAPALLGQAIGSHIRALLPLQATCCALAPWGWPAALALLLLLVPLSAELGRHFHAS